MADKNDILLKEYEVCEQDISSTSINYWTLAGIFIGISSALLGGLLYGILTNIQVITTISTSDALTLRIIISVLSGAIITILVFLYFWLKRVNYLADRNYERMREIELELGMWKSWRIHSIDRWNELGIKRSDTLDNKKIDEIWDEIREKLRKGLPKKYFVKLEQRKKELVQFCNCCPQKWYEQMTRKLHCPTILFILIGLWAIAIASVWLLPLIINCLNRGG
jgi:hypothetical protein